MWFGVISLFPEMFCTFNHGIIARAIRHSQVRIDFWNPRDFSRDKHQSVDDRPYGGGPGMIMMAPPLEDALAAAKASAPSKPTVIYLSPQGKLFDQALASELLQRRSLILLAGRYEGIDERILEKHVDLEISIGDYILTGGELAAMVLMDTITRLIPGVVGDEASILQDSITTGLLKYPQYTRPEDLAGQKVPEVLLSGHHQHIHRWRLKASLGKTWLKRPDLLAKRKLTDEETILLTEFIEEFRK